LLKAGETPRPTEIAVKNFELQSLCT